MLIISDLSFGFSQRRLFAGVSLTVEPGQLVHVAGPNGAGKSTFLAIVAGLLAAESGEVAYRPAPSAVDAADRRQYLEYLPAEANGLYLKMDAEQNLAFWSTLRGVRPTPQALDAALTTWNLHHPLLRDGFAVEKFSTGMKRRLALARVALSPAPCWLLDEPIYGLDAQAMQVFRELLAGHLARGGLALVVSHDLQPLAGLVSRTLDLGTPETRDGRPVR